ncbi:PadR family transcriptional regulator [Gorillibacterium timonense]|uniref:PadR family transcriptional regulator n=1 Tax=Gorillibacterium timonense TaxID=1689269 RepID=UPI00071C50B9|nr:PadR family transcriptional regulator [Gorillibacterium timonense]
MIDDIILGILMEGPMSGYDIKRMIDQSVGFFYTASFGSLYPALKRLTEQDSIAVTETGSSKNKKIYTLLPAGKERFLSWLAEPLTRVRNEHMLKIFFYDYLEEGLRKERLRAFHSKLQGEYHRLKAVQEIVDKETETIDNPEDYVYRLSVLTYGSRFLGMVRQWVEDLEQVHQEKGNRSK